MRCHHIKLLSFLLLALHASTNASPSQLPPEPPTVPPPSIARTLIQNSDEYDYTYDWVNCSGIYNDASYFYLCDCWIGDVYTSCEAASLPPSWATSGPGAVPRQGNPLPNQTPPLKKKIVVSASPVSPEDKYPQYQSRLLPSPLLPPSPLVFPFLPPDKNIGYIPPPTESTPVDNEEDKQGVSGSPSSPTPSSDYFAPSSSSSSSSSSTDVGAIVGGVIGGVVALALAAVGGLFLYKRHQTKMNIMHQPPETPSTSDSEDIEKQEASIKKNTDIHGSASSMPPSSNSINRIASSPPPPPSPPPSSLPPGPTLSLFAAQQEVPAHSPFMQSYLNSDLRNDPVLSLVAVSITSSSTPAPTPRGDGGKEVEVAAATGVSTDGDPTATATSSSRKKKKTGTNTMGGGDRGGSSRLFTNNAEMISQPPSMLLGSSTSLIDIRPWQFNFQELSIQHVIGAGSFGKVYRARWREVLVAAKVLLDPSGGGGASQAVAATASSPLSLSSSLLKKLEDEATLLASLRHPNVVQFLGFCSFPPCIITEYCDRGSLLDVLQRARSDPKQAKLLTWSRRIKMAIEAAQGLVFLHSQNIIHRDFKSPNLLVTDSLGVKITDFNLSKIMEEATTSAAVVSSMSAVTNPRWMSSEQVMGSKATIQSDVFSFGVVMWELLTWNIPWEGANTWAIVGAISNGGRLKVPDVKDLPGEKDTADFKGLGDYIGIMERCWDQDPAKRPDVSMIIAELRRLV